MKRAEHKEWIAKAQTKVDAIYARHPSRVVRDNIAKLRAELPETVDAIESEARVIDGERLARAILNVGISELDWHVEQIVRGEDDGATLAALIAGHYNDERMI